MTEKQIKQKAIKHICKRNPFITKEWLIDAFRKYDKGESVRFLRDYEIAEYESYLAGAKLIQEENNHLTQQIEELKKEKGEMIDELKQVRIAHQIEVDSIDEVCQEKNEQLEQAKEIIKELLTCCRNYPQGNADKMKKAEQFLKE